MSLKTKKRFNKIGKTVGIALFALLMLTNIKIALIDDADIASGDISLFGIELNLFEASYANEGAQDYRLSSGIGCRTGCTVSSGTDYWASCHLWGSQCSIMPCYCFSN